MSARTTRPEPRPRSKSILSFTSNKSHKSHASSGSVHLDLRETAKEKSQRRIHGKADPTMAMNEIEPATAALEKTNLESLRSASYRDTNGDLISEPDRSNPTRSRWERPLDTIRSFEAAIDGSYTNRKSFAPADSSDPLAGPQSRRNSYYQGSALATNNGNSQPTPGRLAQSGSYYGNRWPSGGLPTPDSIDEGGYQPQNYYNSQGRRAYGPRMNSEPMMGGARNGQTVYQSHAYQQSYDTATSGSGSHGTDAWGNSTDPTSSDNSSFDRLPQTAKADQAETYGLTGFGAHVPPYTGGYDQGSPAYNAGGVYSEQRGPNTGWGTVPPPAPPHALSQVQTMPVGAKVDRGSAGISGTKAPSKPEPNEKRKSWFKKRFSKG